MPRVRNHPPRLRGGAFRELGCKRAMPSHPTIGESNQHSTLRIGITTRPAQLIPDFNLNVPSSTPEKTDVERSNSDATKLRGADQCDQGQKRSSECLMEPAQGRKSPKRRMMSEGRDLAEEETPLLACPFLKLDGNRYHGCLKFELHRVKDVKQHISRKHMNPEFYCARCGRTFPDRDKQDDHARGTICPRKAKPIFEGISEEQKYKLRRSGNRGATPQQQWFEIWDILFPSEPRPSSIYLGNFMEETLSYIRKRCQNEDWGGTLLETLREKHRGVNAELAQDIMTVTLDLFCSIIDTTPPGCESRIAETETSSYSDSVSSSVSTADLDSLHEGLELSWGDSVFPATYDIPTLYDYGYLFAEDDIWDHLADTSEQI